MQDVVKQHALCTIERIINPGPALGATLVPVLPPPRPHRRRKKTVLKTKTYASMWGDGKFEGVTNVHVNKVWSSSGNRSL